MSASARESGQATLELVALVPLLLLVTVIVVQAGIAGFCLRTSESAARAGSRAASLCRDGVSTAVNNPPPWLRDDVQAFEERTGDSVRVEVHTQIPILFSSFTLPRPVVRSATYPLSESC